MTVCPALSHRIRVCFLVPRLSHTGPTKQLLHILNYLDQDRFSARIDTLSDSPPNTLLSDFAPFVEDVTSLKLDTFLPHIVAHKTLSKILQKRPADIVHSQGLRADLVSSFLPTNQIRIATQRNYPFEDYASEHGLFKGTLMSHLHFFALRRVTQTISCSQALVRKNKFHQLDTHFIRNGTSIPELQNFSPLYWRSKLGAISQFPANTRIFIACGPLIKRKNIDAVISGFQVYSSTTNEPAKLFVLGDGPENTRLRRITQDDPSIIFTGFIKDISPYLRAADLLISASRSEGFPNAVLESLVNGTPVLLSPIPSHREVLEIEPSVGQIFDTNTPSSIADGIRRCISISANRKHIYGASRELFSAQRMSTLYQQLYLSLLTIG